MRPPPLIEPLPPSPKLTPETLWPAFAARPGCAFLDSSLPASPQTQTHSILACDPWAILRADARGASLHRPDGTVENFPNADPLAVLKDILQQRATPPVPGLPFIGGAIGWLSYEAGAAWSRVYPKNTDNPSPLPSLAFGLYDSALVYDHAKNQITLVAADRAGLARLHALLALAQSGNCNQAGYTSPSRAAGPAPDLTRAAYTGAIARIREYIAAGDTYQVNFTHRFTAPFEGPAASLYARLRALSPAPHSAFLDFGDHQIVSSTPERLLRVSGRHLETRPIKGTVARLADPTEDQAQRTRLLASAKDHAELLMIVDLARNDLGRIATPGSVRVAARHDLETYATVHHLVATVVAELADGLDRFDALRALHPGGSITGAPKIRAMQIIAELEPVARHAYTGALGYLGYDGDADLAIAIRTITCTQGQASYHVGGGITWDSAPLDEYQETLDKGRAMLAALTTDAPSPAQ